MKNKPNLEKEPDLAVKPDEGTPQYADFGSPAEPTAGETGQASPRSKARKRAAGRTKPGGTEAEVRDAYTKEDPRYAGGNEFDLRNEQSTL